MITVMLYGHLAKNFGKVHRFDIRTPHEAVAALSANFPTFRSHVLKHNEPGYHVRVGREFRDHDGLTYPADDVVRIIPAVGGASGVGMVLLGAALFFAAPLAVGYLSCYAATAGIAGVIATVAPSIAVAMMLGGVSQILFPQPAASSYERPESAPSRNFSGAVNTVSQGNPVPICYGELIVGSQVVSATIETGDVAL